ncbi:caspase family protein [Nitrogeniibacter mangrovi]|uniref:Caspase family protein n=1 Tax=Nitrogeniibacter mangrovi TaxID=2016596 RepID=A0A6C1B136_9RHOO|nr:caspase family protein [Nitrogeniibacter mangrovi]QID16538.1 caspase family protein [Nitrogeniibacter mangrovi]
MSKSALCIGINDYPGTDSDLSGCVNDAHDWSALLDGRGFAVRQLLDAAATKASMVAAMTDLITGARSGDSVVITYSGHGTWVPDTSGDEPDGRDEGLCPHDIADGQVLLDDELAELFARRDAGVRVVLISDSCHSGSVIRGRDPDLDPAAPRARFLPPALWLGADALPSGAPPARVFGGFTRLGGDLLLAGCRDAEFSWDTRFRGRPNGAFTYYALKALAGLAPGASYLDWFRAIGTFLPSTSLPQTPQLSGARGARHFPVFE